MATKEKKGGAAPQRAAKAARARRRAAARRRRAARTRAPASRCRRRGCEAFYQEHGARPKLMQQFGLTNPHQVPTLEKIVLNVGVGEAIKQPKVLDTVVEELATITGQQPVRKKAKKSIANFGLRAGPGDRRGGDAARRADVGVPRPVHHGRDPAHSRLPRRWARGRSTDAATTRSASRSR